MALGGTAPRRVHLIVQDWDFYHEPDFDDVPQLNHGGEAYYFAVLEEDGSYSRSNTFLSFDSALAHASTYGQVTWDPPRTTRSRA